MLPGSECSCFWTTFWVESCFTTFFGDIISFEWKNSWDVRLHLSVFFFFPVCKGAKADIVFLTDASWSIGDDNFNKVVKFIFNTVGAFDEISPAGIQVSVILLASYSFVILCFFLELLFLSGKSFQYKLCFDLYYLLFLLHM